ncbi:acetoacetate decarboxylase family protein [Streptomyces sp. NPDC002952]|uniref:acetoacetate decarboxylase family protein n=1 Tax=Streptomyces sp. NPDC002952 TaxID=3364673 RepID=UPI003679D87E
MRRTFAGLAGVPDIGLSPEEISALSESRSPAPWAVRARALCWARRPDASARRAIEAVVPEPVRANATPELVVGALIHYESTPVGPYDEITAVVVHRRAGTLFATVPFMAVDSPAGLVAGRENWALPKTPAEFEDLGRPHGEQELSGTVHDMNRAVAGPGWRIEVETTTGRIPLPAYVPPVLPLLQLGPGGEPFIFRPSAHGRGRRARLSVRVDAPPALRDWFPAGRRTGVLLTDLHIRLPAPTRSTGEAGRAARRR